MSKFCDYWLYVVEFNKTVNSKCLPRLRVFSRICINNSLNIEYIHFVESNANIMYVYVYANTDSKEYHQLTFMLEII